MQWQRLKAEGLIELSDSLVLGVDENGIDAELATRADYPLDRISHQQFANTSTAHSHVTRKATYKDGRYGVVARELASDLSRKVVRYDRECTQTIEADDAELVVARDKDLRNVSALILTGAIAKPIVECCLATGKGRSIVLVIERPELNRQGEIIRQCADASLRQ